MQSLRETPSEHRPTRRALFALLAPLASLGLLLNGCASVGPFVWYADLPPAERSPAAGDYIIGVGDSVSIRVYEQDGLSGEVKIRTDGKIAMPLVGEIMAAGRRPLELSREVEQRLKEFIVTPRVTVNVTQSQPITVTVVGEVKGVGSLTLDPPPRLIEALVKSGGLNEFADDTRIFVLRQFPTPSRVRFTWQAILRNEGGAASFPLRSGDVVVVE